MYKKRYNGIMNKTSYTRTTAKNRRRIQEAFAKLLAERGSLDKITVTDLAEYAEIARGTFYNYYDNLYQIRAELQKEIIDRLFAEYDILNTPEGTASYIDDFFTFLKDQENTYRELLLSTASLDFLHQLEEDMSQRMLLALKKNGILDKNTEMDMLFIINGTAAIIRKYYRNEIDITLEEIRDYLKEKVSHFFAKL